MEIKKGFIECPYCHKIIKPRRKSAGPIWSILIAIVLLCLWILPGIIYIIWKSVGKQKQCPECKMDL